MRVDRLALAAGAALAAQCGCIRLTADAGLMDRLPLPVCECWTRRRGAHRLIPLAHCVGIFVWHETTPVASTL